ncbi:hypothetical protein MVEN_01146800 [Mycena venus]|uniref:Uncharacterized protein n=1 Tax=Mycena venus TaxID=2733690 RepID=A0A8H6Y0M8_9AGAR|nr:hypothetical protein MVEN_01146800 [Mycena venus]
MSKDRITGPMHVNLHSVCRIAGTYYLCALYGTQNWRPLAASSNDSALNSILVFPHLCIPGACRYVRPSLLFQAASYNSLFACTSARLTRTRAGHVISNPVVGRDPCFQCSELRVPLAKPLIIKSA